MSLTIFNSSATNRNLLYVILALVFTSACVPKTILIKESLPEDNTHKTVLVMEPDVQIYEKTAGGVETPKADWTKQASENIGNALKRRADLAQAKIASYQASDSIIGVDEHDSQVIILHEAVGKSILLYQYNGYLPTKKDSFEWTLGKSVSSLAERYNADFILFLRLHDSHSSGGRIAAQVVGALLGIATPGGIQRGFASLVDGNSGDVLWFNFMIRDKGDLREQVGADEAIERLLQEIPL